MKVSKTRMICEAAIFIAMAEILSLIKLYEFPNGGSITLEMLPIILFAARYGCGWGSLAGLVYGTITYLIGNKFSIDWTTIICDYFIAFVVLGFGAGLLSRRKWSVYYGTIIGGLTLSPPLSLQGRRVPALENFFQERKKSVDKRRKASIINLVRQEHSGIV